MIRPRVVIAGGGTGGHIYPGLAIAKVLTDRGCDVSWVGSKGGLEEKIVAREKVDLHLISIGKLHASAGLWTRLKTVLGMPVAFFQALYLVLKLKPDAVLGVGGFASGPFLFVAALLGYRTVIWEPNAHAGMANRILARFVDECLLVFDDAANDLKAKAVSRVGLPVRASMKPARREELSARPFRILVFGGSQGARPINRTVLAAVKDLRGKGGGWIDKVELLHQTGRLDFLEVSTEYAKLGRPQVTCVEYLYDMDLRFQWADLIICRAGASTVAEIATCGKAAVFIPLPTAADDHQLKNARVLERAGAAIVIEQKDFTPERLGSTINRFLQTPALIESLERAALQFGTPQAADRIADHVLPEKMITGKMLSEKGTGPSA